MTLAILRIRGSCRTNMNIKYTLELLHLTRQNHLVLVPADKVTKGMLQMIKDYVTWGEIDSETVHKIIKVRGRIVGDKPLTDEYIKANCGYATARELADAIAQGKANYNKLKDVKPVIRLHPPRGGYEATKRAFKAGGSLGYRGKTIGELLLKMLGPENDAKIAAKAPPVKQPAPPAGHRPTGGK